MGARYGMAANSIKPGKLRPSTRRVLMAMALRVLDMPTQGREPGIYYWGYYRLLGDMGIMPTKTSMRHLKANVAELVAAHHLEPLVQHPGKGRPQQWRLTLPVDNSPRRGPRKRPD